MSLFDGVGRWYDFVQFAKQSAWDFDTGEMEYEGHSRTLPLRFPLGIVDEFRSFKNTILSRSRYCLTNGYRGASFKAWKVLYGAFACRNTQHSANLMCFSQSPSYARKHLRNIMYFMYFMYWQVVMFQSKGSIPSTHNPLVAVFDRQTPSLALLH